MNRKEEIKQQISQLQNELNAIENDEKELESINYHIVNKHCIACRNRDKKADFRIPDGIVCLHPSNQEGKNKFQYYGHTCDFWEQDKEN